MTSNKDIELREKLDSLFLSGGSLLALSSTLKRGYRLGEKDLNQIMNLITTYTQSEVEKAEIALARKVLGVSSMVRKRKGVTQSMRLKLLTNEMNKIIPDPFGTIEDEALNKGKEE